MMVDWPNAELKGRIYTIRRFRIQFQGRLSSSLTVERPLFTMLTQQRALSAYRHQAFYTFPSKLQTSPHHHQLLEPTVLLRSLPKMSRDKDTVHADARRFLDERGS